MEDKIKLLLLYMKKEKEIIIESDREEGIDVDAPDYKLISGCVGRIQSFISYRNIRIEEAWYQKLNKGRRLESYERKCNEYDTERSRRHATALNSLAGFNEFGKNFGLPKFYDGELLTAREIENYQNIPVRLEETAFFLQLVDKLGRVKAIEVQKYFEEVGIEEGKEESTFFRELQRSISKTEDDYNVKQPLLEEDGETIFREDVGDMNEPIYWLM